MAIWTKFVTWLKGKKTILAGMGILLVAVVGVGGGNLDAGNGLSLALLGLSVAGLGAKMNGHQAQVLSALADVAKAGLDLRAGNTAGALQAAGAAGNSVLPSLVPGLAADLAPAAGACLHLSAPTTQELLGAITQLTASGGTVSINSPNVHTLGSAPPK